MANDSPESFREQMSRVAQMADRDNDTWDLSDNDIAALRAVLNNFLALQAALKDLLDVIVGDGLIPESVSYMQQARAAVAKSEGR